MSKSLEALYKLTRDLEKCYQENGYPYIPKEMNECYQTVKQDLELLEQLKQQRDSLAINNGELCVKVCNLEKENQELKDKLNSEALDNWQLHEKYGIYKKVIDWLNQNLNFKIEKHKSCPNCMFVSYKDLQEWLEPSNEIVDLLKEVLEND